VQGFPAPCYLSISSSQIHGAPPSRPLFLEHRVDFDPPCPLPPAPNPASTSGKRFTVDPPLSLPREAPRTNTHVPIHSFVLEVPRCRSVGQRFRSAGGPTLRVSSVPFPLRSTDSSPFPWHFLTVETPIEEDFLLPPSFFANGLPVRRSHPVRRSWELFFPPPHLTAEYEVDLSPLSFCHFGHALV